MIHAPNGYTIAQKIRRQVSRRLPVILLATLWISGLSAAPTITSIANAASNIGFNFPIAQGSIFVIKGSGLGPANIFIDPQPFQHTNTGGTSIAVTVGSTTVNALMYYASDGQVAALLPSNTPLPTTSAPMFTVTYNGQTSAPIGHGIVANNVGLFTLDSSGQGPAIVEFPDGTLVSAAKASNCGGAITACGAANPGDTLVLWATGLGPVNGNDASGAGLGQAINAPLTIWVGGVQVTTVLYQGRSGYIGLDQINFVVPNNAPTGCAVPLVVQIGTTANTVSNTTAIPIANGSRSCTPTNPVFSSTNVEQGVMAGPVNFAALDLDHYLNGNGSGYFDKVDFTFAKIASYVPNTQPFFLSFFDDQPLGTCIVYPNTNANNTSPIGQVTPLDAGANFTVKGPNGTAPVAGNPGEVKTQISASGTFLVAGNYTVTGSGGADVGPFTANLTIPASPKLISPASSNNLTITRSNGLPVTWNPNGSTGHAEIQIVSATDNTFNTGSTAVCTVPASAGNFTVPPYVMLALPPNNFNFFELSPGTVSATAEAPFMAKGLDIGFIEAFVDGTTFGGFTLR